MEKSDRDPKETLRELIEGNSNYVKKYSSEFEQLKLKQSPKVTLLTCCDSRVPQNLFDTVGLNEIFTIRNIGNQFHNSEGSVKYPLLHLKTPLLIVLGHTGCGAIKAALSDYREEDKAIQREVIGLVDSIRTAERDREIMKNSEENQKLAIYAQTNVDQQINQIIEEDKLKGKVKNQELYVVGMIFDIHCVYGSESAQAYITNINGITDVSKLKKHTLVGKFGKEIKELKIKRV